MPEPLYTSENSKRAYQLRWSLALFAKTDLPPADTWLATLQEATEVDGVRVLECHRRGSDVWQFLLSTRPHVAPPQIVKSCKGRLQHLLQTKFPKAFQRHFSLTSLGDANRIAVEQYVSNQLSHHPAADPRVAGRLQRYQMDFPELDLSQPRFSSHGRYIYNLHLVLVHAERWRQASEAFLAATRDMVLKVARHKGHRLSRAGLLPDHLHLALGAGFGESPEEIALAYLNNLAYAHEMQRVYQFGYYLGTFGEYDMRAVRK